LQVVPRASVAVVFSTTHPGRHGFRSLADFMRTFTV
jgi:hypothetical protein